MKRDPRFDVLFEPVKIGPVTSKNRFFQVPHCNGMGYLRPKSLAAMRGIKAEGGWGVVCTEEVYIHPSSECDPLVEGRLWDDDDIPALAKMTEAVHEHGSLAGIELQHGGYCSTNHYSRIPPISPSPISVDSYAPIQARAMDKSDIRSFRKWHRQAALRSKQAGFDIVYVYAAHSGTLLTHFLSRRINRRTDEYGGSLENRVRLFRELIEDTKDAVGDSCAVAVRFCVEEFLGSQGITSENEGKEIMWKCWQNCRIFGMLTSATGAWILLLHASKVKAIKNHIWPLSNQLHQSLWWESVVLLLQTQCSL